MSYNTAMDGEAFVEPSSESQNPKYTGVPPPSYQASYGTADTPPNELPTYEQATEAPPSYQSIFGNIREARDNSSGVVEFLKKLFVLLAGTVGCTVFLGFTLIIPIAMIVMGSIYKDDCRIQPKIPIYLIVGGSVGLLRNCLSLCHKTVEENEQEDHGRRRKKRSAIESLLDCFLTVWFVVGNVWIYKNYKPNFTNPSHDDFCNRDLYWFAFWLTTTTYIFLGILCFCVCCIACCVSTARRDQSSGP